MSDVSLRVPSGLGEFLAAEALQRTVWGEGDKEDPADLMMVIQSEGGLVAGAFSGDELVDYVFGFPARETNVQHSHRLAVHPKARGAGLAVRLKFFQRSWCLSHGITLVRWTFDPLLAANASFNLVRLGVRIVDFLPNCYGERRDAFNTGDVTDRVEVSWQLDHPVGGAWLPSTGRDVISVPGDYQRLRTTDITAADQLRRDIGAALADVFRSGRTIAGLTRLDDGVAYLIGAER